MNQICKRDGVLFPLEPDVDEFEASEVGGKTREYFQEIAGHKI